MKKNYQTPAMKTVEVKMDSLCGDTVSEIKSLGGNASLKYGGGDSGAARGRQGSTWDDDED